MIARKKERIVFLALLLGILLLFLFEKCTPKEDIVLGENIISHTIDTVLIKGKLDTITFTDTVVTQIVKYKYIDTTEHNTSLRVYTSEVEDSLLSGTIYTKLDLSSCNIIDQSIEYTAKFPKFITRIDTLKINEKIVYFVLLRAMILSPRDKSLIEQGAVIKISNKFFSCDTLGKD